MKKRPSFLAVLLAAMMTLSGCGSDAENNGSSTESRTEIGQFNDADVTFAQEMIPHHQQALEMAQMADDRASSPEVKALAADIEAAQDPEIDQMTNWLEDWGQEFPSESMDHGDMGHGDTTGGMPGMMDAEAMDRLEKAEGDAWDKMFLSAMIEHHEGAIDMARIEQDNGENPDAIALAKKIQADQQAEVTKMNELLDS